MSYLQFPSTQMLQVVDTGEKLDLGGFQPAKSGELRHVRLDIFARGTVPGSVSASVGLHLTTDFTGSYALSDAIFLTSVGSAITGTPTGDWRAMVRFDFDRPNINKNQEYRLSLQLSGYTRNADTFYIAVVRDYPFPVYTGALTGVYGAQYPAHKSVFAYVEPS